MTNFPARVAAFSVSWTAALNADFLSHISDIQTSVVFCPSFCYLPGVRRLMRCWEVLMPYDCRWVTTPCVDGTLLRRASTGLLDKMPFLEIEGSGWLCPTSGCRLLEEVFA
ncbi:hypothetical protein T10_367 [Trichinella papuae]|uniref:Uncharacterized protein n=1 Tax=Trichinella papuae TaxID=268474 RepID=A0A0V1MXX9_9BILA|nr:hypothetical protein T10_367 [Trichinella papuae]